MVVECPLCESKTTKRKVEVKDYSFSGELFNVFECKECPQLIYHIAVIAIIHPLLLLLLIVTRTILNAIFQGRTTINQWR